MMVGSQHQKMSEGNSGVIGVPGDDLELLSHENIEEQQVPKTV